MPYLLNVVYLLLILLCSPYLAYAAIRHGKYRDGWSEKFLGRVPRRAGSRPCIWLHAVSVGEVNLLQPLLTELAHQCPTWECVISTTTRTGFALARKKYAGYQVFYCPLDFTWAVRQAVRRVRPDLLVLAELELWPNLIRAARRQGAKVAVVNGRLSDKSYRGYRRIRPLLRPILRRIDLIAVQNEHYAERFRNLGGRPESIHVTGCVKFDGAVTDRANPATMRLRALWNISDTDFVFLAGSTQAPEEEIALRVFRQVLSHRAGARLILVPRHPERFDEVAKLLDQSGLAWQRRTALKDAPPAESFHAGPSLSQSGATPPLPDAEQGGSVLQAQILLVDVVGELGAWWGLAHAGFVGGSLGRRGGQNMIEPAAYGVAVSVGPNTWNFRDIVALLLQGEAMVVVRDEAELVAFLRQCADSPQFRELLGARAQRLVMEQQGATGRTIRLLLPLYSPPRRDDADPALPAA
jgi:3-deoxy-D-manno-octulosonic-acid transferase